MSHDEEELLLRLPHEKPTFPKMQIVCSGINWCTNYIAFDCEESKFLLIIH